MLGFFPEQTICQMVTGLWTKVRFIARAKATWGCDETQREKMEMILKKILDFILMVKRCSRLHPSWLIPILLESARLATKRKGITSLIQLRTLQGAIIKGPIRHAQWYNSGMCIMGLTNRFFI